MATNGNDSEFLSNTGTGQSHRQNQIAVSDELEQLWSSFEGIILAAMVYPAILVTGFFIFQTVSGNITTSGIEVFGAAFFFYLTCMIIGSMAGMTIGLFSGLVSVFFVHAVNSTTGTPLKGTEASIAAGSLAGYLPAVWLIFILPGASQYPVTLLVIAFGPVLASCLGAFFASRSSAKYRSGFILERASRYRLKLKYMFAATAWIAAFLSISNFMGGLNFLLAVAGWLVMLAVILSINTLVRAVRSIAGSGAPAG